MMHLYGKIVICVTCLKTVIANGWLLEDSGYLLRPWLLTPVINPTTRKQQRYNSAHMLTPSVVERRFVVLKSPFLSLDTSAGTLLYTHIKCCYIVIAVVVLQNVYYKWYTSSTRR